ncbi:hypothetical protein EMGBD1_21030 [Anaerolineaceae bacterium]|nr:hypothetical protein EMGBD1_21030 [Anaerolineaceae bacterium]
MKLYSTGMPQTSACQSPENCGIYGRSAGFTQKRGDGTGNSACPR